MGLDMTLSRKVDNKLVEVGDWRKAYFIDDWFLRYIWDADIKSEKIVRESHGLAADVFRIESSKLLELKAACEAVNENPSLVGQFFEDVEEKDWDNDYGRKHADHTLGIINKVLADDPLLSGEYYYDSAP